MRRVRSDRSLIEENIRDAKTLTDDILNFILKCLEEDKEERLGKQ